MDAQGVFHSHPVEDVGVVSSVGLSRVKLLGTFTDRFSNALNFSLPWETCPVAVAGWYGGSKFNSVRDNCKTLFQSSLTLVYSHVTPLSSGS